MPSGRRHYRITRADVEEAHAEALSYGGREGILNEHAILSAIGRPYNGHYPSIQKKAAALAESLTRNHGYTDGNKRTALLCVGCLLRRSGFVLLAFGDTEDINAAAADLMVRIADGKAPFDEIEQWFKTRIVRIVER